jgi:hypothetical protein
MNLQDIIEGKLPNKHKFLDALINVRSEPREIRQTYNKCYKNKLKNPSKKRATLMWAEFMLTKPRNLELKAMLEFIIEHCKK